MRSLADRLREQARAEADDRELTSRTDRRREQRSREDALKRMANRLVALKSKQLERLALNEELLDAVVSARNIKSANAKNRQVGVVRQHLRDLGPGALELQARLDALLGLGTHARPSAPVVAAADPAVGAWLERLVADGDAAIASFLREHATVERQSLRQQVRAVSKARGEGGAGSQAEARLRSTLAAALDAAGAAGDPHDQ